ncbi:MAG: hypothetical protein NZM25_03440 [Leptospiraceae bacterium]|nr:hypothetical protein [Leptospiraceae bacterium]MDW8306038.1 hypothetical protein [Leptospiraceae bacterium]
MKAYKYLHFLAVTSLFVTPILAQQQQQNQQQPEGKSIADEAEAKWHNPDYRPYLKSFDDLIRLSDAYAENKLRLALSNYQTGRSIIQKMREDVQRFKDEAAEAKNLNEKWYWQTLDRKAREERIIQMKKQEAKLKAVTYFTRAINHLDDINNKKVRESEKFKELQADVYRDWVIQQTDLGNIPQTIDILERYLKIDPKYEQEVSPHRYLASAYAFKEAVMTKYNAGTEQERLFYKKKKNEHLLRATELKYRKDSPEYEQILDQVNRDEIIAISNN